MCYACECFDEVVLKFQPLHLTDGVGALTELHELGEKERERREMKRRIKRLRERERVNHSKTNKNIVEFSIKTLSLVPMASLIQKRFHCSILYIILRQ